MIEVSVFPVRERETLSCGVCCNREYQISNPSPFIFSRIINWIQLRQGYAEW